MLNPRNVHLGIAPIGWTNDDMPDLGAQITFEQCISEMALSGYRGCEVGNKYPRDTTILKKALNMRNLQICNAWFSTYFTTKPQNETIEEFKRHMDFLLSMDCTLTGVCEQGHSIQGQINTPLLLNKPTFTPDEWNRLAEGLNTLGQISAQNGMTLTYHHHMGTGVQSLNEIDRLMESTEQNLVYLLFDTGHLTFAGEDPLNTLKKYIQRIRHVHLKDIRNNIMQKVVSENMSFLNAVRKGVFTVPGDGIIDFAPIIEVLDQNNYKGWLVVEAEQDPAIANPFEYALKARQYINQISSL